MARRSHSVLALVLLALAGAFSVPRASGIGSEGRILRVDPRFDELVPAEASLEKVVDGFTWLEGPVWSPERGSVEVSVLSWCRAPVEGATRNEGAP